jgi:hypothetical protein
VCKAKKREMMRNKMREIDELSKQQETRKLYTAMKQINRSYQPKAIGCQSKNGEMISDKQRIRERWREYFQDQPKQDRENEIGLEGEININEEMIIDDVETPPTIEEMEAIMEKIKKNGATGEEKITIELTKMRE